MVCLIVDEKGKIRRFKGIEQAEKYMSRHEGIYFLIEPSPNFVGVSVIKSESGEVYQLKGTTVTKSD